MLKFSDDDDETSAFQVNSFVPLYISAISALTTPQITPPHERLLLLLLTPPHLIFQASRTQNAETTRHTRQDGITDNRSAMSCHATRQHNTANRQATFLWLVIALRLLGVSRVSRVDSEPQVAASTLEHRCSYELLCHL